MNYPNAQRLDLITCDNPWCGMWGIDHTHPKDLYYECLADKTREDIDAKKAEVQLARLYAAVAFEFSEVLHNWLTEEEMDEVVLRNANEYKDSDVCASHDFCDANMAMEEAFHNFGLKTTADLSDGDEGPEWTAAQDLWNAAWDLAKKADFRL